VKGVSPGGMGAGTAGTAWYGQGWQEGVPMWGGPPPCGKKKMQPFVTTFMVQNISSKLFSTSVLNLLFSNDNLRKALMELPSSATKPSLVRAAQYTEAVSARIRAELARSKEQHAIGVVHPNGGQNDGQLSDDGMDGHAQNGAKFAGPPGFEPDGAPPGLGGAQNGGLHLPNGGPHLPNDVNVRASGVAVSLSGGRSESLGSNGGGYQQAADSDASRCTAGAAAPSLPHSPALAGAKRSSAYSPDPVADDRVLLGEDLEAFFAKEVLETWSAN